MQDNRATSTRKNIRFDNELLAKIESKLGGKPFGTWVQEVCRVAVNTNNVAVNTSEKVVNTKEKKTTVKNSYASSNNLPNVITKELHQEIMRLHKSGLSSRKIAEIVAVSKASINRTITASNI